MTTIERDDRPEAEFGIVGIGASAGGIAALQAFFSALPVRAGLAFVVIQHLLPDHPSHLAELLGKTTAMAVHEAGDGMKVESGHVYVIAPGAVLTLEQGILRSRPFPQDDRVCIDMIDRFFASLAADRAGRAIAVVLSGTGNDGAAGAQRIRQSGGTVYVQNPTSAMYGGMPCAAIATGAANHILPADAIARELSAVSSANAGIEPVSATDDLSRPLDEILALIRTHAGSDMSGYKFAPLFWQIQRRMQARRIGEAQDYARLLQADPAELEALIREMPIHVTQFFRDPEAWEILAREVIAALFRERNDHAPLRAWTPACSTGEEAYSVAMLLAEQAGCCNEAAGFQIFATDASAEIVARAGRGVYSAADIKPVSPERLARFFDADPNRYRVKQSIRDKMVFAPHHLLDDPPFAGLDLITCRNLLIYLEPYAQQRVLAMLHASLKTGGYLFLGSGETLHHKQGGFEVISSRWHIYRKTGLEPAVSNHVPKRPDRLRQARNGERLGAESAHWAMLEEFDLPSVLIDEQFTILRVFGDTGAFLRLPTGQPTLNLLAMAPSGWGVEIRLAAGRALKEHASVNAEGLADPQTGKPSLTLKVTPLFGREAVSPRLLVSFVRTGADFAEVPSKSDCASGLDEEEVWRTTLRMTIEELEASREELHVLNEELRAVNEQLNLSYEEINDVNARLRAKIQELETQSHVLSSGEVMTLFVDRQLRIRWFTSALSRLLPLRAHDNGRKLSELAPRFVDERFIADILAVIETGASSEGELQSFDGHWFLRRIRPFRTGPATTGAAITFTDITDRKAAEEKLRLSERRLRDVVESLPQLVWTCLPGGECDYLSPQWVEYTGMTEAHHLAYGWLEQLHPDDRERVAERWRLAAGQGERFRIDFRIRRHDGVYRWFHTTAVPLCDENGSIFKWFGSNTDIDDWIQASEALRVSEERLRLFVEHAPVALAMFDRDMRYMAVSRRWLTEYLPGHLNVVGCLHYELFPDCPERWKHAHQRALAGEVVEEADCWQRENGQTQWVRYEVRPWFDNRGEIGGIMLFGEKISEPARADNAQRADG